MRFSIVIPNRNREDTLHYTLQTCIEQANFDDYEIVVYDNASDPPAEVRPRCTLYRGEEPLSMTRSWEAAVGYAKGDYIIVVGSDDGMIPHALHDIDEVLTALHNPPLLRWNRCYYTWANATQIALPPQLGVLQLVKDGSSRMLDAKKLIDAVARGKMDYTFLPMLYTAAIRRDLLDTMRERTGSVFHSVCPDIFSGFAFASLVDTVPCINKAMTISGGGNRSTGFHVMAIPYGEISKEFLALNRQDGLVLNHRIPEGYYDRLDGGLQGSYYTVYDLGLIDWDIADTPEKFTDMPAFDGRRANMRATDVYHASIICGRELQFEPDLNFVEW